LAQGCRNLAVQQVGSYPGHTGCCGNAVWKARDPLLTSRFRRNIRALFLFGDICNARAG
jgi:hypothetical protein